MILTILLASLCLGFSFAQTPPLGNVDVANTTLVAGWACDPDNFNRPVHLDIFIDTNIFAGFLVANLPREPAVAALCGGRERHGFSFIFPTNIQQLLSNGQRHTVSVISRPFPPQGPHVPIPGSPVIVQVSVANNPPKGNLDLANATTATGWACDPNDFGQAIRVDIYVDNNFVGSTTANQQREAAVGAECGGNNNRGFTFTFPRATQQLLSNGQSHTVQAFAINIPTGNNPELGGSPKTVLVPQTNRAPTGFLDFVNTTLASGWACDPDAFSTPLRVDIYVGEPQRFAGSVTANIPREAGVAQACGGNANHGFVFVFAPGIQPGTLVRAFAINVPTGSNPELNGSPKTT